MLQLIIKGLLIDLALIEFSVQGLLLFQPEILVLKAKRWR